MSTIEQPPFERQPIETYVLEYDEGIVSEAIRKELARGGRYTTCTTAWTTLRNAPRGWASSCPGRVSALPTAR